MTREEQDKLWNGLSEEKKKEYRKEFQQESESYHQNVKHCDRENEFEYSTGYSDGVASVLEELFGEHNLKHMTYEDICKKLAKDFTTVSVSYSSGKLMADKISAIHKLLMVAKFLNKNEDGSDWVPDWKDWGYKPSESKWYFLICDREILIKRDDISCSAPVYFRTKEIAQQAIEILGEDVIRTALTTEY